MKQESCELPDESISYEVLDLLNGEDIYLPGDLLTPQDGWKTGLSISIHIGAH